MNAVNMRSNKNKQSVSERRAERKAIKVTVSRKLESGDRVTIMERINEADSKKVPAGKGISYHAVVSALNPNHILYSERVISEARILIEERKSK